MNITQLKQRTPQKEQYIKKIQNTSETWKFTRTAKEKGSYFQELKAINGKKTFRR